MHPTAIISIALSALLITNVHAIPTNNDVNSPTDGTNFNNNNNLNSFDVLPPPSTLKKIRTENLAKSIDLRPSEYYGKIRDILYSVALNFLL